MDKLDKFISENARLFDDSEPDKGHFERFTERLDRETVVTPFRINRGLMLRIAAVILVLITATVLVFDMGMKRLSKSFEMVNTGTGLTNEMQDAMFYYDGQTSDRLGEFNKLACCGEEKVHLNSMVSSELNSLDASIAELKQALRDNPDNERLQAALIRNQQMKNQVLDNMISQMKKIRK